MRTIDQTGFNNSNWKFGRSITDGYWYIRIDNQYVREHVYFYEQYHKCCMLPWGEVHHIDENKENNMIWNLQGMMKSEHMTIHHVKEMDGRRCSKCDTIKTYMRKVKMGLRPLWKTDGLGNLLCNKCYSKNRYYSIPSS